MYAWTNASYFCAADNEKLSILAERKCTIIIIQKYALVYAATSIKVVCRYHLVYNWVLGEPDGMSSMKFALKHEFMGVELDNDFACEC